VLDDALRYLIQGIPLGCVYGLVAIGLVLTYKTSGVFNLAFGVQAFLSAVIYNELRTNQHWGIVPAALIAVVVVAPLVGLTLDRVLFRFLRSAEWQVKLITALGLLTGLPVAIDLVFGGQPIINPAGLAPDPHWLLHIGDQALEADEFVAIVATVAVLVLLGLLFRYTTLGLQMRAIVESPRMVELAGVNSERVGMTAWMISGLMAGLAGVLLAPLYGQVLDYSFTLLLVVAIAAAAGGGLTSIPLAFAGAIGLGIAQEVLAGELNPTTILAQGLRPTLPFVVLFAFLVLSPTLRRRREVTDPLRGVDPPPPNLAVTYQDKRLRAINRLVFPAFVIAVLVSTQTWLSPLWVGYFTNGIVLAVTLLSITVITGLAGQVSLAQATFSGIGGFTAAQLAAHQGIPIVWAMFIGALAAGVAGALIAIPSLRLGGIYLTLATLAAALAADAVLFPQTGFGGGSAGVDVPAPSIFGIDISDDRSFFLFAFAVFGIVGLVVVLVRKGTTGRYFAAIRGSDVAAPSIGINPVSARIKVFALSAAIAGLGGGLYAAYLSVGFATLYSSDPQFSTLSGFLFVVLVVSLGSRTVDGAVNAGLGFVLFPLLLDELGFSQSIAIIAFAFGAITYARHPEGIVEFQKLRSIRTQIHHHALAARARALAAADALQHRLAPTAVVALAALPALLLVAGFGITGQHVGPGEVLALGLTLAAPVGAVAVVAQRDIYVARGQGLRPRGALALLAAGAVGLLFATPDQLARLGREKDVGVDVSWMTGLGAAFMVGINILLQLRRGSSDSPTTFGWTFMLVVGTIIVLAWLADVLWALAEYRVVTAERAQAGETEPSVPLTATPVGEPWPPEATVPSA